MKSIQLFNPSSVIYMRAQVNSSTIGNICWLIQTFKYQCCGFQVHFKLIWVYNSKTKAIFIKMFTLHNGLHNKFGPYVFFYFHWFGIWHISIIHSAKFEVYTCSICNVVTIPWMLVPHYSTGWSVAKLFGECISRPFGPRLNIKTVLSTYGDFHVKDKTAVRTSYL